MDDELNKKEKLLNNGIAFTSSMKSSDNRIINAIDSDHELSKNTEYKKKPINQKILMYNYFDPESGDFKKIVVKKFKD